MARSEQEGVTPSNRRRRREAPRQKASFTLHRDVLDAVKAAVAAGEAESASAFVEAAVTEKMRRSRWTALYTAYGEAARDPAFLADMEGVTREMATADPDGLARDER